MHKNNNIIYRIYYHEDLTFVCIFYYIKLSNTLADTIHIITILLGMHHFCVIQSRLRFITYSLKIRPNRIYNITYINMFIFIISKNVFIPFYCFMILFKIYELIIIIIYIISQSKR